VVCGLVVGSVVVAVDIGCAESPWVWLDGRPGRRDMGRLRLGKVTGWWRFQGAGKPDQPSR